ncbi:hypothetical protein CYY_009163 [Polysphondylium violaceum]|uniref:Uncharacterized protein n=1 Tax=Polysphondylium violaceum TaxID=133409 RepID=A0A8J4PN98_9MYCE|nr:hypothetical protein CYY_009163 [Polysphondylium violaceum]
MNVFLLSLGGGIASLYAILSTQQKRNMIKGAKDRVSSYFTSSQDFSNNTVDFVLDNFFEKNNGLERIETPSIAMIRNAAKDPIEKNRLTDQLKISIMTKLFATMYTIPLIFVFNRIQVNIIGRYCYLDFIVQKDKQQVPKRLVDETTEKQYFSFINHLFDQTFNRFVSIIQNHLEIHLKDWKIEEQSSYESFLRLMLKIRSSFESSNILSSNHKDSLLKYLIPDEDEGGNSSNDSLTMLFNETRNIFESQKFYGILKECINQSFLEFTKNIRNDFESNKKSGAAMAINDNIIIPSFLPIEMEIPKPLSTMHNIVLLPKINKLVSQISKTSQRLDIITKMSQLESVKSFNYSILTNDLNFNKVF